LKTKGFNINYIYGESDKVTVHAQGKGQAQKRPEKPEVYTTG
jgi:hypothetical protein